MPRDLRLARNCLLITACRGNVNSMYQLGEMYYLGSETQIEKLSNYDVAGMTGIDPLKCITWWICAANRGHAQSAVQLGYAFAERTSCVWKDTEVALRWFRIACSWHPERFNEFKILSRYPHIEGKKDPITEEEETEDIGNIQRDSETTSYADQSGFLKTDFVMKKRSEAETLKYLKERISQRKTAEVKMKYTDEEAIKQRQKEQQRLKESLQRLESKVQSLIGEDKVSRKVLTTPKLVDRIPNDPKNLHSSVLPSESEINRVHTAKPVTDIINETKEDRVVSGQQIEDKSLQNLVQHRVKVPLKLRVLLLVVVLFIVGLLQLLKYVIAPPKKIFKKTSRKDV